MFIAAYSVAIISNPRENKPLGNGDSNNGDLESNDSSSTTDEIGITLKEALRTRSFYGILVGVCCGTFTYSALLPYVSSDLLNAGTDAEMVSIAVGLFAATALDTAAVVDDAAVAATLGAAKPVAPTALNTSPATNGAAR